MMDYFPHLDALLEERIRRLDRQFSQDVLFLGILVGQEGQIEARVFAVDLEVLISECIMLSHQLVAHRLIII